MSKQKITFLLVDDLPANLIALEGLLRRDGLELVKAQSGPEALELLLAHEISLAFLDVQMPGMSGFELAEAMRGTSRTRHVPIIFLTAGAVDQQRRFEGYEMGAVDFLFKPLEPHILQSKASVFFELARQRNELRDTARKNAELVEALQQAQRQLQQYSERLEKTVDERTAKLRETIGELEHFSYTITHDMRAPLRAMSGLSDLLRQEYSSNLDEVGWDYLRRISDSASRMDHLITDALNYSKAVRNELTLEPIDPRPLLREIVESYPQFHPSVATIEIAENFHSVLGNRAALTQVFSNLLDNAVKFAQPGALPRVRVFDEERNGVVRIWIEDEGIGIPDDQLKRVFQMFYRIDQTAEGTGVGLALVHKVIDRMRGKVGVESEVGKGSRFWIELAKAS